MVLSCRSVAGDEDEYFVFGMNAFSKVFDSLQNVAFRGVGITQNSDIEPFETLLLGELLL